MEMDIASNMGNLSGGSSSMTAEQIQSMLRKKPFVPYTIRTNSGEEYTVSHPEAIWQAREPEQNTIILQDKKLGVVFTDVSCIAEVVFATSTTAR